MARKHKKNNDSKNDRVEIALKHARTLGLNSLQDYQEWCRGEGLSARIDKTQIQRRNELTLRKSAQAKTRLRKHRQDSNLRHRISQIYNKEITVQGDSDDVLKAIQAGFRSTAYARSAFEVLLHLERHSRLIADKRMVSGVFNLISHRSKWLQPLKDWQPKTHNADRQFASLARFLLAKYDVPGFLDSVWFESKRSQHGWFIHLGLGLNIRTAKDLPVCLTRKMAHWYMQTPSDYCALTAFRWGQVRALGGSPRVADAITHTRLGRQFSDDAFCQSVIRFVIDNPMLDLTFVNPIIDYIWNQKYDRQLIVDADGVQRHLDPVQPNFSMHGRSAASLLRQMEIWHTQLGREQRGGHFQWAKRRIDDFAFVEGQYELGNHKTWTIRELLSSRELIGEGRRQQHCVASYASACYRGNCSIFTMDLRDSLGISKKLTIEVNLQRRQVVQMRGKRNRLATRPEMAIVRRWVDKENLTLSRYC